MLNYLLEVKAELGHFGLKRCRFLGTGIEKSIFLSEDNPEF